MVRTFPLLLLVSACSITPAGRLADLRDLEIDVSIDPGGGGLYRVDVDYQVNAREDCVSLDGVEVELNGVSFDLEKAGEWRDTSLAGSADHCVFPYWRLAEVAPADAGHFVVTDSSATLNFDVEGLFTERELTLAPVPGTDLAPGDEVMIRLTGAPGDSMTDFYADAMCSDTERLFQLGSASDFQTVPGGVSFVIPSIRTGLGGVLCGEPPTETQPGEPLLATLRAMATANLALSGCEGAVACTATAKLSGDASVTVTP